jgi:hypothetical protein
VPHTTAVPRSPTNLQDQIDRLTDVIGHLGRINNRAYDIASGLAGHFLTEVNEAGGVDEPSGQVDTLRLVLDEVEHRLRTVSASLEVTERALRGDQKSTVSAEGHH